MKSFYPVLYLCFLFGLLPFLGSCSEENESSGTIEMNQLPGTAQSFLSNYFPGQTPEKIERTNTDQENARLLYRVVFPNEVKVEFSENGGWKRLMIPDQKLPGSLDSLWGKIIEYVQQLFPDDPFTGIENACYGDCVLLSSGKKIAFYYDGTCIGYEMDIKDESGVPQPVRDFVATYFPDGVFQAVVEHIPNKNVTAGYSFWLENGFKCVLNDRGQWTEVNGGTELLPVSILEALPAKVTEQLYRDYPAAQVTYIRLEGTCYTIQVSKTVYVTIDPESKPIVVPVMQAQALAEEYFGKLRSISISHPLHTDVLNFKVCLPNGFNMLVNEDASEWLNIDGNGFAFPEKLVASLPEKITEYISAHSNSEITRVDRSVAASFLVELTNGDGLMFDSQGGFLGKEKIELSISEKTYRYMRHQFPDDLNMYFSSYSIEGWIYKLGDGSQARFDRDGNFVEMIAAAK